ncbi:SDR family NAD(P)-dependent oxidoreductase [Parapedobacter indicus]|uniref:Short-chain dehydrogenase n=1 Tax=Parapedobacter indicus TaxID=1477437 RepID=A0A1I3VB88_9SPHI|nr:SDR family NAD(P)-dependent oxidoreductase [Parapedobacter indicus]PPK98925.1 short-subunit dehydrogenase [Parapedobacter indicus]SFJ92724.1 Short-chain dehydrogenase [Parapedobacter indicus]
MELKNKKVLITGGSAGIGKAIAKELIQHGVRDIAVVGRKKEPLEMLKAELKSADLVTIQADLSVTEDINNVVSAISQEWGMLDILINSAGVVSAGLLTEQSDEDIIGQVNINFTGLVLLTKKLTSLLQKSDEGAIVNISSGYGYIAMPFYSVYAATKAAVAQFSDAMRRELYQYPIHVMTVYPSATDTGMMKTAVVDKMDSPEDVAKATVAGLIQEQINVIIGGEKMEEQVKLNFLEPKKIDQIAADNFEVLRKRTKNHRSM